MKYLLIILLFFSCTKDSLVSNTGTYKHWIETSKYGATMKSTINAGNGIYNAIKVTQTGTVFYNGTGPTDDMRITFSDLPTFANDTAAGSGGLTIGMIYKTATGELRIKL